MSSLAKLVENIGPISHAQTGETISAKEIQDRIYCISKKVLSENRLNNTVFLVADSSINFLLEFLGNLLAGSVVMPVTSEQMKSFRAQQVTYKFSEPGILMTTSGTTSISKICFHNLENIAYRVQSLRENIAPDEYNRTLCFMPLHFGHGLIGNCLFPWLSGAHLILSKTNSTLLPTEFSKIADFWKPTFTSSIPSLWKLICSNSNKKGKSFKRIHCASEAISLPIFKTLQHKFPNADIYNVYGLTEFASWVSGAKIEEKSISCIGTGWGCDLKLNGNEIYLQSDSLMKSFSIDGASFQKISGWFPSGDLGERAGDSGFSIVGREKNVINRSGIKISAEGLENLLLRNPDISEACAFGLPDELLGEELFVAAKSKISEHAIMDWMVQQDDLPFKPKKIFLVESLPRTPSRKLDRRKVFDMYKP